MDAFDGLIIGLMTSFGQSPIQQSGLTLYKLLAFMLLQWVILLIVIFINVAVPTTPPQLKINQVCLLGFL